MNNSMCYYLKYLSSNVYFYSNLSITSSNMITLKILVLLSTGNTLFVVHLDTNRNLKRQANEHLQLPFFSMHCSFESINTFINLRTFNHRQNTNRLSQFQLSDDLNSVNYFVNKTPRINAMFYLEFRGVLFNIMVSANFIFQHQCQLVLIVQCCHRLEHASVDEKTSNVSFLFNAR